MYECEDCSDCPLKSRCTKAEGNRQVHYNPIYEELKTKAKVNLWSESNAQIYARRKIEVENVFGHINGNRSFRRFLLRGLPKVQNGGCHCGYGPYSTESSWPSKATLNKEL
ncbi:transposase [Peribacillus sp. NPDC006672]|uniref:transposase n=1 Tax=Peribacillus sp. NPDC006672 TaxID=3390606 RepID=UPI003CFE127A